MFEKIANGIDCLNEKIGFYASYVVLPLLVVIGFEVFMRYALNAPTIWAFELTVFLYGIHYSLVFGYGHKYNSHVNIDVIEKMLKPRTRNVLRIITNVVMFLPTIGLISIWACVQAYDSTMANELASSTWMPKLWPYKIIMALGLILFWLQGIAHLIHDIRALKNTAAT